MIFVLFIRGHLLSEWNYTKTWFLVNCWNCSAISVITDSWVFTGFHSLSSRKLLVVKKARFCFLNSAIIYFVRDCKGYLVFKSHIICSTLFPSQKELIGLAVLDISLCLKNLEYSFSCCCPLSMIWCLGGKRTHYTKVSKVQFVNYIISIIFFFLATVNLIRRWYSCQKLLHFINM
jgi:hypothetical protein